MAGFAPEVHTRRDPARGHIFPPCGIRLPPNLQEQGREPVQVPPGPVEDSVNPILGRSSEVVGWNFMSTPTYLRGAEDFSGSLRVRKPSARKFPKATPTHCFHSADGCRSTKRHEMTSAMLARARARGGGCKPNQPPTNQGVRSRR